MIPVFSTLTGGGLFARALRGSAFIASGFVLGQGMRLLSNLILTRLLFPEAFGLMALVSMVMIGLAMFSDVGIGPAILSSKRADEPRFLDTAWSIQVLRGFGLWLVICALALPLAQFYRAPELAQILPVAGITLLIAGFNPTRIETANRHLSLGRVTALDLASQLAGILLMIGLSLLTHSVWALVWGNLAGAAVKLALMTAYLPGHRNRFGWDRSVAGELLRYGGWIFLSTACGFLLAQGDKAILGRYLSLDSLGIYNVGYFLASFPVMLTAAVVSRIFIPIYRDVAEDGSERVRRKLRRMRFGMTGIVFLLVAVMALAGLPLVGLLYDQRYAAAGAVVVAIACLQLPLLVVATYDQAALAAGDSRGFFLLSAFKAGVQTTLFLLGAHLYGLPGALIGQGIAGLLIAPATMALAIKHRVHDPLHDLTYLGLSAALVALALWQAGGPLGDLARL